MPFAVTGCRDQHRHLGAQRLAAQVERRIGARSQPVEGRTFRGLAFPRHAAGLGMRLAEIDHQRCAVQPAHAQLQALLLYGHLDLPRAQAHGAARVVRGKGDGLVRRLLAGRQRTVQRSPEMKRAAGDPDQLSAAAVEPQLHLVTVRQNGQQRGHRRQRLRRHYSRTISRWIWPVTRASRSPMNMLISERTPNVGR